MSGNEYYAMHREAEQGDDKNKYDDKELENAFADLDKDGSASLSLDEWRRPFEEHTDAWLQVFSWMNTARAPAHTISNSRSHKIILHPRVGCALFTENHCIAHLSICASLDSNRPPFYDTLPLSTCSCLHPFSIPPV